MSSVISEAQLMSEAQLVHRRVVIPLLYPEQPGQQPVIDTTRRKYSKNYYY